MQSNNFDPNNKNTWWFVSNENMMLTHNIWGNNSSIETMGVHDCIEQTYHAYVAYGYKPFIDGIRSCWVYDEANDKYKPQRYPISYPGMRGMSRDHVIYSLMAFIYSGMPKNNISEYVKRLPFNIGNEVGKTMTPELWLWGRLISGKLVGCLFYPLILIEMIFYYFWNIMVDKIAGFELYSETHPSKYSVWLKKDKPKKYNYLGGKLFPTYALKLVANMTSILPDNWFIKMTRKIGLKMTPTYNYVIRLLFKGQLNENEIIDLKNYEPIYHERWSAILNNKINDRLSYKIVEHQCWNGMFDYNNLDKDYALKLLEKTK